MLNGFLKDTTVEMSYRKSNDESLAEPVCRRDAYVVRSNIPVTGVDCCVLYNHTLSLSFQVLQLVEVTTLLPSASATRDLRLRRGIPSGVSTTNLSTVPPTTEEEHMMGLPHMVVVLNDVCSTGKKVVILRL